MRGLSRASAIGATYPDASNTGATLPGSLFTVTTGTSVTAAAAVTGGADARNTGWTYTGSGWTFSSTPFLAGLSITAELDINVSNTTVTGCALARIVVAFGGPVSNTIIDNCTIFRGPTGDGEGIKLGNGTTAIPTDTTIRYCTIAGLDGSTNRLAYGIDDNYANLGGVTIPGGLLVLGCNIYNCRSSIQIASGVVQGNYIHDPGLLPGDHVDCFLTQGGAKASKPLLITGNSLFNDLTQTAAILLASSVEPASYMTVTGNLLAGGSYPIYGGNTTDANIRQDKAKGGTSGTTSVTDTAAAAGDLGAQITCTTGGVIPANTTIIGVTPGTGYTLSQNAVGTHAPLSLEFDIQHLYGARTDPGCTISGGTTLTDPSLVATDAGAAITGAGIPTSPPTTISGISGTTATLSQACTNGSGLTVALHYTNNIVIKDNRISAVYFPNGGNSGLAVDFDQSGVGNVWLNNVVHETGAQIPA